MQSSYENTVVRIGEPSWHALYTRHQHEKNVAVSLSSKGFEVFLPLYHAARQWKDRVKELSLPLFPCYVFLRAGLERRLDIITTPGVHNVVMAGAEPALIEQSEIEAVRRVVEGALRSEPHPFLNRGDWVMVRSGPLAGMEGILVRKKNSSRLVLSVAVLEKSIAVEVDALIVERIRRPDRATHQIGLLRPFSSRPAGNNRQTSAMSMTG